MNALQRLVSPFLPSLGGVPSFWFVLSVLAAEPLLAQQAEDVETVGGWEFGLDSFGADSLWLSSADIDGGSGDAA